MNIYELANKLTDSKYSLLNGGKSVNNYNVVVMITKPDGTRVLGNILDVHMYADQELIIIDALSTEAEKFAEVAIRNKNKNE